MWRCEYQLCFMWRCERMHSDPIPTPHSPIARPTSIPIVLFTDMPLLVSTTFTSCSPSPLPTFSPGNLVCGHYGGVPCSLAHRRGAMPELVRKVPVHYPHMVVVLHAPHLPRQAQSPQAKVEKRGGLLGAEGGHGYICADPGRTAGERAEIKKRGGAGDGGCHTHLAVCVIVAWAALVCCSVVLLRVLPRLF